AACDKLARTDPDLGGIITNYGYPPMWVRDNTFETLVHFILEQQVSLASALSALNKLKERAPDFTPGNILAMTDQEMRDCYCSRQKQGYIKNVAAAIVNGSLRLHDFNLMEDEEVRAQLTSLKGIGNWTADVYLMFVLQRADIFPSGDLAAVNALKSLKSMSADTDRNSIVNASSLWKPYRTIATMMLWHFYLCKKSVKRLPGDGKH
ncbi:MAG: DNA-3-methyladenine glycosylase 2 family protein, partial [Chitinophagaceae bacterium]